MILAVLTLLTALAISAVAAYYSIIGLIAIFSAAVIPIAVMGVVLETGKLVTAAWVYHNWKRTPKLLKSYLISAVVVLMFITSMGIFGFLSKAHIEQTTVTSDNTLQNRTYRVTDTKRTQNHRTCGEHSCTIRQCIGQVY